MAIKTFNAAVENATESQQTKKISSVAIAAGSVVALTADGQAQLCVTTRATTATDAEREAERLKATPVGIALCTCTAGQPVVYATEGAQVIETGDYDAGNVYFVAGGSGNDGKVYPSDDFDALVDVANRYISVFGIGIDANNMRLAFSGPYVATP